MPLSTADYPYLQEGGELLAQYEQSQTSRTNRTETNTISRFVSLSSYDLRDGLLPMLGSKKVPFGTIFHELAWMLKGDASIRYLLENNCHIWDNWLVPGTEVHDAEGKLIGGDVSALYPTAWRKWEKIRFFASMALATEHQNALAERDLGHRIQKFCTSLGDEGVYVHEVIDQMADLIARLKSDPHSRRHLLTAWDPADNDLVKLPACHSFVQFYVEEDNTLSACMYMRSSDHFLGKPFNIVQYALLTHILAHLTGRTATALYVCVGDQHLYVNHVEAMQQQLEGAAEMVHADVQTPRLKISESFSSIDDMKLEYFTLEGYEPGPVIKGDVAV